MRLSTFLDSHAVRVPDRTALVVGDDRLTYGEHAKRVANVARGLHTLGLKSGDRIAVYLPNGIEFVTIAYAAFSLGAVVVPVTTRNTLEELVYYVADSGASVLAFDGSLGEDIRKRLGNGSELTLISLDGAEQGCVSYASIA